MAKNENTDEKRKAEIWIENNIPTYKEHLTESDLTQAFLAGIQAEREEWERKVNELFCTIANNYFTPYEILDLIDRTFEKEPAKEEHLPLSEVKNSRKWISPPAKGSNKPEKKGGDK